MATNTSTMTIMNDIRNFDPDRMDLDELVALVALGHQIRTAYNNLNVEEPDWFTSNLKSIERATRDANSDNLDRKLKLIDMELDGLKSKNDKKAELMAERDRLRAARQGNNATA